MRIVPFERKYDRSSFDCGVPALNHYLQRQISQDCKRRLAYGYLALDDDDCIMGYYTLSAYAIPFDEISVELNKKLPFYNPLPAILMGRLAVDCRYRGQKVGSRLLVSALNHIKSLQIGCLVLVVEAKDDTAIAFYRHFGFLSFQSVADKLYYPLN